MLNISYSEMGRIAERSVHEDRPIPYSVEVLDVTPRMASVRTDADWGVDYIHLAKLDGDWKVVNVLWDARLARSTSTLSTAGRRPPPG